MISFIFFATVLASFQIGCDAVQKPFPNSRLNFFDIDLLMRTAEDKKGNIMISPASIKSTLAMILEGAEGATAAEIKAALRVSPEGDDFRKELDSTLKAFEAHTKNTELINANALFVSDKLKLKTRYQSMVTKHYLSEINSLNFTDTKNSTDTINEWVNVRTKGLIPKIVEEAHVTPTTEMMITNVLFFKAPWKYSFDSKTTHKDCFYVDDVCRSVAMMDLQAELKYAFVNDLRAHAIELPYQSDRYSMLLLVPQDRNAGMALLRDLPYVGLPQISDMMYYSTVYLTMPKFSVDYSQNMVAALKNMRINSLFSRSANLSGIFETGDSTHLNNMYHSVHMNVNEEGTVAAAATVSLLVPLINNQVQLRIDRPFLFFIRDNELGSILFQGKIEEPTEFVEPSKDPSPTHKNQHGQGHHEKPKPPATDLLPPCINQDCSIHFLDSKPDLPTIHSRGEEPQPKPDQIAPLSDHLPSQTAEKVDIDSTKTPIKTEEEKPKKPGGIRGFFKTLGSYF